MIEIKDIWGDEDLKTFKPSPSGFMIIVTLCLGYESSQGGDYFEFTLVDEKGLHKYVLEEKFKTDNVEHYNYNVLVIEKYSFDDLIGYINKIIERVYSPNKSWSEIAVGLNNYFYWEYYNEWKEKALKECKC